MHFSSEGHNPEHYVLSGSQKVAEEPPRVLRLFPLFVVLVSSLILLEAGVKNVVYVLSFTPEMTVYVETKHNKHTLKSISLRNY